ncbi:hypothetical protein B0I35DRAFT_461481 [Stachybotrys elegans]|uniref:Secreted protein n=1 Tax=Stachybotrys elegans TaxID=80388 RepID=A0A8K0WRT4_9HYPO|nr:hypothetical protein B0I35DRAFT_461481 [Stachybotrys elegans]
MLAMNLRALGVAYLAVSVPLATAWQIDWYSDENCQDFQGSQNGDANPITWAECDLPAPPEKDARSFRAYMDETSAVRVCDGGQLVKTAGHEQNSCRTIENSVVGKWIERV